MIGYLKVTIYNLILKWKWSQHNSSYKTEIKLNLLNIWWRKDRMIPINIHPKINKIIKAIHNHCLKNNHNSINNNQYIKYQNLIIINSPLNHLKLKLLNSNKLSSNKLKATILPTNYYNQINNNFLNLGFNKFKILYYNIIYCHQNYV